MNCEAAETAELHSQAGLNLTLDGNRHYPTE